jgi:hypothetical protein
VSDDPRGARVLVRLAAELEVDPLELGVLTQPWRDLARTMLAVGRPSDRLDALRAALAGRADGEAIRAAILAAGRGGVYADGPGGPAVLVRLSDTVASPVRWLWPGRVPLGKLTILDGDPGRGKSAITLDVAARVSAGRPMPDGAAADVRGPRGVVLLSAEDGLADTIHPRLEAAGADLARVAALTLVEGRPTSRRSRRAAALPIARLPTLADLDAIRRAITAVRAALVVIDPIMAYLPDGVDSSKDDDVRAVLARLAGLAETEVVAILAVRHLTKARRGNPLYRGGGSIGIIGAARSGLLVGNDPLDETGVRRVLAATKANLAIAPPSLAYHLETADNGSLRVVWEGPTDHTAASLLDDAPEQDREGPTALAEAGDILRLVLADGPRPAAAVLAEARAAGVGDRTLRRARRALGIRARKTGPHGTWVLELPLPSAMPDGELASPSTVDTRPSPPG